MGIILFGLVASSCRMEFYGSYDVELFLSSEVEAFASLYKNYLGKELRFDLHYFDNEFKEINNIGVEDFPIRVKCSKRNCVSLLLNPKEEFLPATSIFPWKLDHNKGSLILTYDDWWLDSQIFSVTASSALEQFNYIKAKEFLCNKKLSLLARSPLFLDEQRIRRDLASGRVNSFSWKTKEFGLWEIESNLASRILNEDPSVIFYDHKIKLSNLLVIQEEEGEPIYFLKIPSGYHLLYDLENGIKFSLWLDETKNPAVISVASRIK